MAFDETRRIQPNRLQADRDALSAVQNLQNYRPANADYTTDKLTAAYTAMEAARTLELNALNALDAARIAALRAEWAFHNAMLGAKDQVMAQYGADSDEIQSLGLKRKSARKRPLRRSMTTKLD